VGIPSFTPKPVVLKLFCMFYPFKKDDYQIYCQYKKWCSFITKRKKQITSAIFNATDALAFWQRVVQYLVK